MNDVDRKEAHETLEFWLGEDWKKISDANKEKLAQKLDNYFDSNLERTDGLFKRIADRREVQGVLWLGIAMGIAGNLVADVMSDLLSGFKVVYYIGALIFFIFLYRQINKAFDSGISKMMRSTPTLKAMLKESEREEKTG